MKVWLTNFLLLFAWICFSNSATSADKFPLQDGDTWVMIGDSITAQHLHSNYFEAFCYARYPQLTFHFRNSGVGGDTIPRAIARFDWDAAAWKPTVISVELGMNDQGGFTPEQFVKNMVELVGRIRSTGARPVIFTSSPINDGGTMAKIGSADRQPNTRGNARLNHYATDLKQFATEQNAPFADQFHSVIDIWGKNKPLEVRANLRTIVETAARDESLAGVEHLKAFLAEQAKSNQPLISMQGDPVHPGPPGQLIMAAALLKELGAEGFVSSVVIDGGKLSSAKGCTVDNVKADGDSLSFDRLDETLPFPISSDARPVLAIDPTILSLSQYTLQVSGLKGNHYDLKVNGTKVATVTSNDLSSGVNLTSYGIGPIAAQGQRILQAVNEKEGLVGTWRGLSRVVSMGGTESQKADLTELAGRVTAADAKIRAAAKPEKLHFELTVAK